MAPESHEWVVMLGYAVFLGVIALLLEWAARHTNRRSFAASAAGFTYHSARDVWSCPRNQPLFPVASSPEKGLVIYRAAKAGEIAGAIDKAKSLDAAALNVLASPFLNANRGIILERTAAARLPAIYQWPETAEEGGLIAYGPRIVQLFRDVLARQCVRLLQGAKPADTPVEQPTKFELVVNLKTAKAIAVNVPNSLLLRADEVIE